MHTNIKFCDRLVVRLIAVMLVLYTLSASIYCYYSYENIRLVYYKMFDEKIVFANRMLSLQISADEVEFYINRLLKDKDLKQKQLGFYNARKELLALRDSGPENAARVEALSAKVAEFYREFEKYKDANYYAIIQRLADAKRVSGAKYVYIFADTGIDGMYTYIFDANDQGPASLIDGDGLGSVIGKEDMGREAAQVLSYGTAMDKPMPYSGDLYGDLYYSYIPLKDHAGKVVAVIGTDTSVDEMRKLIFKSILLNVTVFMALAGLSVFGVFFFFRRAILAPVTGLTETAVKISEGEVYAQVPESVLKFKNELGVLARSVCSMSSAYQKMVTQTRNLFEAALNGRLDARNEPRDFKGEIALVMEQINGALDSIILYMNSMHEGLFIVNQDMEIVFANKKFRELFGNTTGVDIFHRIFPDRAEYTVEELREKIAKNIENGGYGITIWVSNGPIDYLSCFSIALNEIVIGGAERINFLGIATDVTDLMLEKEKAQAANVAKSEFMSRISHELCTPMVVVSGMASLGLDCADQEARERFRRIDFASKHMMSLINNVLDMSKIEAGTMEIHREPFNIHMLFEDCGKFYESQAKEKKIELALFCEKSLPTVLIGDIKHLRQVLLNLLENAFKFTKTGGRISVNACMVEMHDFEMLVSFEVSDNGIGMSEKFLAKIFTPFEQEDEYLQRKYQGAGLGVSICKKLVELMGGELRVDSKRDIGTTFIFKVPLEIINSETEAAPNPVNNTALQTVEGKKLKDIKEMHILLVDDIDINRMILTEMLEHTGVRFTEAENGYEALKLFSDSAIGFYDLIFMDVQMPTMDGYEATRRIRGLDRKDASSVPIIAMTANALKQDEEKSLKCGMNGYLSKPVNMEDCLNCIEKYR